LWEIARTEIAWAQKGSDQERWTPKPRGFFDQRKLRRKVTLIFEKGCLEEGRDELLLLKNGSKSKSVRKKETQGWGRFFQSPSQQSLEKSPLSATGNPGGKKFKIGERKCVFLGAKPPWGEGDGWGIRHNKMPINSKRRPKFG